MASWSGRAWSAPGRPACGLARRGAGQLPGLDELEVAVAGLGQVRCSTAQPMAPPPTAGSCRPVTDRQPRVGSCSRSGRGWPGTLAAPGGGAAATDRPSAKRTSCPGREELTSPCGGAPLWAEAGRGSRTAALARLVAHVERRRWPWPDRPANAASTRATTASVGRPATLRPAGASVTRSRRRAGCRPPSPPSRRRRARRPPRRATSPSRPVRSPARRRTARSTPGSGRRGDRRGTRPPTARRRSSGGRSRGGPW